VVGEVFGTPQYMSPEQSVGNTLDHRSDIYSLGVILYELTTGRVPFDAEDMVTILGQQMHMPPKPFRELGLEQEIPPAFEQIVFKCLAKKPSERYQSMNELIADLDSFRKNMTPSQPPSSKPSPKIGANIPVSASSPDEITSSLKLINATPRWPLYVGGGVGVAALLMGALYFGSKKKDLLSSVDAGSLDALLPIQVSPSTSPSIIVSPVTPPEETEKRKITISVEPKDSHVFSGDRDLGTGTVKVEIGKSETLALEIRRAGYVSKRINLGDDSQADLSIRLQKKMPPKTSPNPTPLNESPSNTKPNDSGNLVDPWKKKK